MNIVRVFGLACAAAAVLLTAGCGPGSNDPPTDEEIFSVYTAYWREHSPAVAFSGHNMQAYLTPVGMKKQDAGITEGPDYAAAYSVMTTLTYRANGSFSYNCTNLWESSIQIQLPDPRLAPFRNQANTGDIISCPHSIGFQKVKEGWLTHFGMFGSRADYLVKR